MHPKSLKGWFGLELAALWGFEILFAGLDNCCPCALFILFKYCYCGLLLSWQQEATLPMPVE